MNKKKSRIALILLLVAALSLSALSLVNGEGTLSKEDIAKIIETKTDTSKIESPILNVAKSAMESIVGVNNYQKFTDRFSQFNRYGEKLPKSEIERLTSKGSGVVVTKYGHIVTNYHVVDEADRVSVSFDGKEFEAKVVASDPSLDLAIIYAHGIQLPAVELGDSDSLQVGEYAIVIGNPLSEGLERTVTAGFVSGINREVSDTVADKYGRIATVKNKMIQVDAAINSGNSGGGMFNSLGQLQGIPSIKFDNRGSAFGMMGFLRESASIDNIGMCIPVNMVKPLLQEALEKYDENAEAEQSKANSDKAPANAKPRMGITIENVYNERGGALPNGARITNVEKNSPAEKAGLKINDIIVEINETIIRDLRDLKEIMDGFQADDKIQVKVFRQDLNTRNIDGEYMDFELVLKILDTP